MEPNKLEQDFRNKLEQRTIEPSPMAWDRLDAMLSVTEEKRRPKRRTWMYAAASFLGFMLVGAILLKQEKENTGNTINITVVNAGQPAIKEEGKTHQVTVPTAVDELISAPAQTDAVVLQQNNTAKKPAQAAQKRVQQNVNTNNTAGGIHNIEETIAVQEAHESLANESEQLLSASMDESSGKKSSIKVNANSLLSSVEGELDNNFRQDVLQKVIKNYNTVKTSVANRNYEHR